MEMFDKGSGTTVVVVQPLQGRWQWMRRFLEALARRCRVITYTLAGDFGADRSLDRAAGFEAYVRQLEDVIDRAGVGRIALCGISFGGTVAVRYAARHPERVTHLIIASSPGPGWRANARQATYISRPLLTLPLFMATSLMRIYAEVAAALPRPRERLAFAIGATMDVLRYPALPWLMARRVRLMQTVDLAADCARITAPTLIVTGDPSLDLVVPVDSTRQYLSRIRGSRYEMMENTGHTGSLIVPERLARIVGTFVDASST
jgi:pimeloyl-ACP methyl ester carboxylesterase